MIIDENYKDYTANNTFKSQGAAVGYSKGHNIDIPNQDKFLILLDGNIEIFIVVDGHGPYGSQIAQIIQDNLFKVINGNKKLGSK